MKDTRFKILMAEDFRRRNHSKYYKYFEEWFKGITADQKEHFKKQLIKKNIYKK